MYYSSKKKKKRDLATCARVDGGGEKQCKLPIRWDPPKPAYMGRVVVRAVIIYTCQLVIGGGESELYWFSKTGRVGQPP
ncbi:hypothetical protein S83_014355 [Arachis hypogaea]